MTTTQRERPSGRVAAQRGGARPPRRRVLARRWVVVLVMLVVTALVYLLLFTPVLGVRSVEVSGNKLVATKDIVAAAAIPDGTPMFRVDTDAARDRVARLPRVASVDVSRSWPATVRITITERIPVALVKAADGYHEIDGTGVDFAVIPKAVAGIPALVVAHAAPDDAPTVAAVAVLTHIPKQLLKRIKTITPHTPGDVQLALKDGKTVKWGNADQSERKAAVLAALLTRPGKVYNVAAPDAPAVSD
ncbi:cell division protein FtsQ/DivIB [Labedaea rhizosphaerae]|uniref:Cell division protein FtsQ n=1 Tax=Labedaea rhizosphaerae TaxID=598644 RepID=A0A4R6SAZ8_LABRH|nr:FtsQ-type POTRA domain-containing protein [Labedaea rhizosphaerae]TDP97219.1 cell division protein FtsQ [Labedaea rhizosphaerae]